MEKLPSPPPGCKSWIEAYDKLGKVEKPHSYRIMFGYDDGKRKVEQYFMLAEVYECAAFEMREKLKQLPSGRDMLIAEQELGRNYPDTKRSLELVQKLIDVLYP